MSDFYNEIGADGYDEWAKHVKFNEPENIVALVGMDSVVKVETNCEILDAGAGTGVIGRLLKEKGFTNMTAVDPSESMLGKLRESAAYKKDYQMYLGLGLDKYPDELKGAFDLVIACGSFLEGHIPDTGLDDIHASLKTNGHFIVAFKDCYWVDGMKEGYKEKCDKMVAEGKFQMIHTC